MPQRGNELAPKNARVLARRGRLGARRGATSATQRHEKVRNESEPGERILFAERAERGFDGRVDIGFGVRERNERGLEL